MKPTLGRANSGESTPVCNGTSLSSLLFFFLLLSSEVHVVDDVPLQPGDQLPCVYASFEFLFRACLPIFFSHVLAAIYIFVEESNVLEKKKAAAHCNRNAFPTISPTFQLALHSLKPLHGGFSISVAVVQIHAAETSHVFSPTVHFQRGLQAERTCPRTPRDKIILSASEKKKRSACLGLRFQPCFSRNELNLGMVTHPRKKCASRSCTPWSAHPPSLYSAPEENSDKPHNFMLHPL